MFTPPALAFAQDLVAAHGTSLAVWVRTLCVIGPHGAARVVVTDGVAEALPDSDDPVDVTVALSAVPETTTALACALFWPMTEWTLLRRRTRDWVMSLGVEVDNVLHVTLPTGEFTAMNLNAEWVWVSGHHAIPAWQLTLSDDDVGEWLSEVVAATLTANDLFWPAFTEWYTAFRERTGTYTGNEVRQRLLLERFERYDHHDEPEDVWPGWEDW